MRTFLGIIALVLAALASARPAPAARVSPTLPFVSDVEVIASLPCDTCAPRVCPGRAFGVRVQGVFPDDCLAVTNVELIPSPLDVIGPPILRLTITSARDACNAAPTAWNRGAILPGLPAGDYLLPVQVRLVPRPGSDPPWPPDSLYTDVVPFRVGETCPPTPLPYVDEVRVEAPACVGDGIPIVVRGMLADDCVVFQGAELVRPLPPWPGMLPRLRLWFRQNDCLGRPCAPGPFPFEAHLTLPPQAAGTHELGVQVASVSWCDPRRLVGVEERGFGFAVADSCGPPPACLFHQWGEPPFWRSCNALLGDGRTAITHLQVASRVALAGLQGVLRLDPSIRVEQLEPVGPAAGMHLDWVLTADGARFVMFAEQGAPIPPIASAGIETASDFARVLRVTVRDQPGPGPGTAFLRADSLIGADSLGALVPECLIRCDDTPGPCLDRPAARFCRPATCDHDGDGVTDVRDLVLMAHCVLGTGACADTTRMLYDCDGDGDAELDDVLCCARVVLWGGRPDSLVVRPDPRVALRFGEPRADGAALALPVVLEGADRVGAARLVLSFPSDRYTFSSLLPDGSDPDWLVLHEHDGERVVLGLVALGPGAPGASLPVTLRLELKSGRSHGGVVEVAEADISATDGALLLTTLPGTGALLTTTSSLALSAVRPNPTAGRVAFSLDVPRATDVDLAVFDLAGRRLVTLHGGRLRAGRHPFAWDGRDAGGRAASDGIYFVRARSSGGEVARKAVMRRER